MNQQTQAVETAQPMFQRPARGQVAQSKKTIRDEISGDRFKLALAKIVPKHLTPDRIISVAISAMTRNPDLAKADPATFYQALMKLSALGLEPDGYQAHLIPFWSSKRKTFEVQLIVDYKGLVEIAMRTGMFSQPPIAQVVRWNDEFVWNKGVVEKHVVDWRSERGPVYAAYVIVKTKAGGEVGHVMSKDQIEDIRRRSKSPDKGPWDTDWEEMAKKTVFRQMSKWLPRSPEFRDTLEADLDIEDRRFEAARPIFAPALTDAPEPAQLEEQRGEEWRPADPGEDRGEGTDLAPEPKKPEPEGALLNVGVILKAAKARKVTEAELLTFMRANLGLDDSVSSLEEASIVAMPKLKALWERWSSAIDEIEKAKQPKAA